MIRAYRISMHNRITDAIEGVLTDSGIVGEFSFSLPPKADMGDVAFPCFQIAKATGKNPAEAAKDIAAALAENITGSIVREVKAFGPYVNFYLDGAAVARLVMSDLAENGSFGRHTFGRGRKVLVEYGCPNTLKAFHLGHLRNLVSGESVARILTNAGYSVKRLNYQGDVGMHVAKTLWAVNALADEYAQARIGTLREKIAFLGRAYAYGATEFEKSESVQKEIGVYNEKVYEQETETMSAWHETRSWSLAYYEEIYGMLGTKYDHYYFESETYARGVELVNEFLKKDVFLVGDGGAIIFPGSKYGLHDRVFINSKGYPTYEAKEVALAERHFAEHHPDRVIHVVGKDQTEYFKVLIKAVEQVISESVGKEFHLVGGYLQLKGEQKMSSRKGNVVTGDALVEAVQERILEIMQASGESVESGDHERLRKITVAALKYSILKVGISDDIAFDMEASVSTEGDSGPYLLYIIARINSILKKAGVTPRHVIPTDIDPSEKQLLMAIADFPSVTAAAAESLDPSHVTQYLFTLAQRFNTFYHACPVIQAEETVRDFRLYLIGAVCTVMKHGLDLLGIEAVEEM